jgi:hypothetical protein
MFDEQLVHAIVDGKHLHRGPAELRVSLGWMRGHGTFLPDQ